MEVVHCKTGKLDDRVPSRLCKQLLFERFVELWDEFAPESVKSGAVKLLPEAVQKGQQSSVESDIDSKQLKGSLPFPQEKAKPSRPQEKDGNIRRSQRLRANPPEGGAVLEAGNGEVDASVQAAAVPGVTSQLIRSYCTYGQVKSLAGDYRTAKNLLSDHLKSRWGSCWIRKPVEQENFHL